MGRADLVKLKSRYTLSLDFSFFLLFSALSNFLHPFLSYRISDFIVLACPPSHQLSKSPPKNNKRWTSKNLLQIGSCGQTFTDAEMQKTTFMEHRIRMFWGTREALIEDGVC